MNRSFLLFFSALLLSVGSFAQVNTFFDEADLFLKKYVVDGSVSYSSVKKNLPAIEKLYQNIGNMNLANVDDATKKAFYINAYNLVVIYWVAKHYPLKSPMDNSGFFDKVKHKVAGEEMTLNGLEIRNLLSKYKDPRIHFVLACAARSCPPLASFSFRPGELDKHLDERTKLSINNPNWIRVNASKKRVELSKIFEWYAKDFESTGKTLLQWVNQYRTTPVPSNYSVGYYEYNWQLNDLVK